MSWATQATRCPMNVDYFASYRKSNGCHKAEISHTLQGNLEKQSNCRTTTAVTWAVRQLTSRFFFPLFFCYVLHGRGCWQLHDNREFLLLCLLSLMTKTSSLIWKSLIFTVSTSIVPQSTTKISLCIQFDSTTNKEGRCLLLRTGHQGLSLQPCDVHCEANSAAICSMEEAISGVMVNWVNLLCSRVYISRCRISFNFR